MIDIIPYWCYPYVIPTFHVVIIHRLFFLVTRFTRSLVGCSCSPFLFYHIEVAEKNVISNKKT